LCRYLRGGIHDGREAAGEGTGHGGPESATAAGGGRAEDALKVSEEKYKLLIEVTNTGYVIIDERGREGRALAGGHHRHHGAQAR
jgi:hypothetical protein